MMIVKGKALPSVTRNAGEKHTHKQSKSDEMQLRKATTPFKILFTHVNQQMHPVIK